MHDKKFWPKDYSFVYGDNAIKEFAHKFGHSTVKMLAEFRTFKETSVIGDEFQLYVDHARTYAISSSDAERGFSSMNIILTDDLNCLLIENVSSLMLISTINMPIEKFNPKKYVEVWLRSHQNSKCFRNSTKSTQKMESDDQYILHDLFS